MLFRSIFFRNFVLPEKPARGLNRQVAHGSTFNSHWSNNISEENTYLKTLPTEILPQDVCEDNGMTNRSFEYSDDELALARTLHTLKSTNVRTGNEATETSDDESTNILGTRYLRKRSKSDSNIALQDDSNVRNTVSKISYGKHRASKSFDELTFNRVFPTYEFAYVTAVREETDANDLKMNPSVITCDSVLKMCVFQVLRV